MSLVIDGLSLDADFYVMLVDNAGPFLPCTVSYGLLSAARGVRWFGLAINWLREESVAEAFSSAMGWAQSMTSGV